ncbi:hypothetical protein [Bacillus weihaiensis]|uniref:Uncharacterized protein n=1 Tax=Bacillus weihaiensis TaxID=1547283 RepID=A0A1L3MMC8_9BACI|nr:hypothetical protein [Bacillus weihaiensis]APH03471.1 hypothetical protein A9C19_01140 [Bacillus weihaiensis]
MDWKDSYIKLDYISREIEQFNSEYGDEIELEIVHFYDHFRAFATICQDESPFKDYFAEGVDYRSSDEASKKALEELYRQAYYIC